MTSQIVISLKTAKIFQDTYVVYEKDESPPKILNMEIYTRQISSMRSYRFI
jgi:hypothetical protein